MGKIILFDKEAEDKILSATEKISRAVSVTMGPRGKNVILGKFIGTPVITKDGVSVAREVVLSDPVENLVAQLIKEAAGRTADIAGDGTTTATILTEEILKGGRKLLSSGYSPLDFRNSINHTLDLILEEIDFATKKIASDDDLKNIATISANSDCALGNSIAEAFSYSGLDGTVVAEANPGRETYVKKIQGLEIKSGFSSNHYLTNKGQTEVSFENCYILVINRDMTHFDDCIGLFTEIHQKNIPVLILAKSVQKQALLTLIENNRLGKIRVVSTNLPSTFADPDYLENLAILTGAKIAGDIDGSDNLINFKIEDLGFAKKVIVDKFSTKILDPKTCEEGYNNKIIVYNDDLQKLLSESGRARVKQKIKLLNGKAAVVVVGYETELELREKSDRVDDAIHATKAALESGVVSGGGITLLNAANRVDLSSIKEKWRPGAHALVSACIRPINQIIRNADIEPEEIIEKIIKEDSCDYGYNVSEEVFGDMFEMGIIDPAKVTKTALANAVSIALLLINTEAIISEDPDKPTGWQPPPGWRPPDDKALNHKY